MSDTDKAQFVVEFDVTGHNTAVEAAEDVRQALHRSGHTNIRVEVK